jgi:hypothetical protein
MMHRIYFGFLTSFFGMISLTLGLYQVGDKFWPVNIAVGVFAMSVGLAFFIAAFVDPRSDT